MIQKYDRLAWLTLLLFVPLLFAACGSENGTPPSNPPPTGINSPDAGGPPETPMPDAGSPQNPSPPPTADPHACDNLKVIEGWWRRQMSENPGSNMMEVTLTPILRNGESTCAVENSGDAPFRTKDRPIYAKNLPVEESSNGNYMGMKMQGSYLILMARTPRVDLGDTLYIRE